MVWVSFKNNFRNPEHCCHIHFIDKYLEEIREIGGLSHRYLEVNTDVIRCPMGH